MDLLDPCSTNGPLSNSTTQTTLNTLEKGFLHVANKKGGINISTCYIQINNSSSNPRAQPTSLEVQYHVSLFRLYVLCVYVCSIAETICVLEHIFFFKSISGFYIIVFHEHSY